MIVTVDTNVFFQALHRPDGASNQIVKLARQQQITVALSIPIFTEYRDVLLRPSSLKKFKLDNKAIIAFLGFLAILGKPHDIFFLWRPNLRDEADNIFIELAVASRSEWLITSNIRDFTVDSELLHDGLKIGTPAQFLSNWRTKNE